MKSSLKKSKGFVPNRLWANVQAALTVKSACLSLFPVQYRATRVHMSSQDIFIMTVTPYTEILSLASPQPYEAAVNILRSGCQKCLTLQPCGL